MSKNAELLARVKRLHEFAGLLHTELGNIKHSLEHDVQNEIAAPETSPEDRALMEAQLAEHQAQSTIAAELKQGLINVATVVLKYLSPSVIQGGRGFIAPRVTFPQYEESIMGTPVARVMEWPSGFYRDDRLKEVEFFLRLEMEKKNAALCITGLPSNGGKMVFFWHDDKNEVECAELHKVPNMTASILVEIKNAVEKALSDVLDKHYSHG